MKWAIFIDMLIISFIIIKLIVVMYGVSVASESKESQAPMATKRTFYVSTIC